MKNTCLKNGLVVSVILLFIGVAVAPSINVSVVNAQDLKKQSSSKGNWLYVGGPGPGNYTSIQDAIDNASDGDTVFVYDESSPYNENITIPNSINLIGENKETTVLMTPINSTSVTIPAADVLFSGFTIRQENDWSTAIVVRTDDVEITGNVFVSKITESWSPVIGINAEGCKNIKIMNNVFLEKFSAIYLEEVKSATIDGNSMELGEYGIQLQECTNILIKSNTIDGCLECMEIYGGSNTIISNNSINTRNVTKGASRWIYINTSSDCGLILSQHFRAVVTNNIFNDCMAGIFNLASVSSFITRNTMSECFYGVLNLASWICIVVNNDFLNNTLNVLGVNSFGNLFLHNYWERSRLLPKPILNVIGSFSPNFFFFPSLIIDFLPAFRPHTNHEALKVKS